MKLKKPSLAPAAKVIISGMLLFSALGLQAEQSPFVKYFNTLYCAKDEQQATELLQGIPKMPYLKHTLPYDINIEGKKVLYAASLDAALLSLYSTAKKYPALSEHVELALLNWNYCHHQQDGQFFDTQTSRDVIEQIVADPNSPAEWEGFEAFGFLGKASRKYVPQLLSSPEQRAADFEYYFHKVYRKQCFPHPYDARFFHRKKDMMTSRLIPPPKPQQGQYPFEWNSQCTVSNGNTNGNPAEANPDAQTQNDASSFAVGMNSHQPPSIADSANDNSAKNPTDNAIDRSFGPQDQAVMRLPKSMTDGLAHDQAPQPARPLASTRSNAPSPNLDTPTFPARKLPPRTNVKSTPPTKAKTFSLKTPRSSTEANEDINKTGPTAAMANMPANASTLALNPIIKSKPKDDELGISVSYTAKGFDKGLLPNSLSMSFSWQPKPDDYYFLRGNVTTGLNKDRWKTTYAWGLGYSDWHPGTWSFQLNHWGPIEGKDFPDVRNAIAAIGYKPKSDTLKKLNMGSSFSLSAPLNKKTPALSTSLNWSPIKNVFVNLSASQSLDLSKKPAFSSNYGYSDWRPETLSLQLPKYAQGDMFSNFPPNPADLMLTYKHKF